MSMSIRRWAVAGWAVLVLVAGAATLYLEGPASTPAEPPRWERPSSPAEAPVPCPSLTPGAPETRRNCTSWERG